MWERRRANVLCLGVLCLKARIEDQVVAEAKRFGKCTSRWNFLLATSNSENPRTGYPDLQTKSEITEDPQNGKRHHFGIMVASSSKNQDTGQNAQSGTGCLLAEYAKLDAL